MNYRCFCCDVDFDSQIAYEKHCKSDSAHQIKPRSTSTLLGEVHQ